MIYLIMAAKYLVGIIFLIFIVGLVIGALMVIVMDYEWVEEKPESSRISNGESHASGSGR